MSAESVCDASMERGDREDLGCKGMSNGPLPVV